ncbi:acyl-CoA-binding protein [Phanerochaete sordida]|uniref:Acyl-CoA-binding protein n=1 Tax=Phanerochaete sordida TaxID=48140 RepID=A0A9P3FZC8_9APHY|nr:acyl-CoA-binding protein [Phanerochaete sordida]
MDPLGIIDAQFNRAVEIVQNLPKTGPIQTGYEDKLNMYSLFKQATMGNVQGPRPSMWELLPRAKWDAWAKHKDLDAYQAKVMYVEALLKVLRRYSDKTIAMDYVRELESYTAAAPDLVMSGSFSRSRSSSSSSSGSSQAGPSGSHYSGAMRAYPPHENPTPSGEELDELPDEPRPPPPAPSSVYVQQMNRPQSSLSSRRYRTPMASMHLSPPPASMSVPPTQPMPRFEAPSAYAEHSSIPSSAYAPSIASYPAASTNLTRTDMVSSPDRASLHQPYRTGSLQPEYTGRPYALQTNPAPFSALERAIQNVQTHLAALSERIDSLENIAHRSASSLSGSGARSPHWLGARGASPLRAPHAALTFEDVGMWALVLNPLAAVLLRVRRAADFLRHGDNRSPTLVVLRRLILDVSFLLCVLAASRLVWRRSGTRRQAVRDTLQRIWWILIGRQVPRVLVDRGI